MFASLRCPPFFDLAHRKSYLLTFIFVVCEKFMVNCWLINKINKKVHSFVKIIERMDFACLIGITFESVNSYVPVPFLPF